VDVLKIKEKIYVSKIFLNFNFKLLINEILYNYNK